MTTYHPKGVLARLQIERNPALRKASIGELLVELLARIESGSSVADSEENIALGDAVQEFLATSLEVHENRFSIQRLHDLFYVFYGALAEPRPTIQGASFLDLGCGSHNPLGLLLVFVALGAHRAIGVDLETPQDPARAIRAMARSVDALLADPTRILQSYDVTRDEICKNILTFDIAKMRAGRQDGIDENKLTFMHAPASSLPFSSGSVDVVLSNSFLEHVEEINEVLDEMARITAIGGVGIHNIDGIDHFSYGDTSRHPLDFLRVATSGMVNGSNRIRVLEFPELFRQHGFEMQQIITGRRVTVDDALQSSFVPPWHDMPRDWLEVGTGTIVVRRG